MIRYNELAKVNAVETFRNELGGFKVGRGVVSFRSPTKCPVLAVALAVALSIRGRIDATLYFRNFNGRPRGPHQLRRLRQADDLALGVDVDSRGARLFGQAQHQDHAAGDGHQEAGPG